MTEAVKLEELVQKAERRKTELGFAEDGIVMPANSGISRTPEKRALLRALRENALRQGKEPWKANY